MTEPDQDGPRTGGASTGGAQAPREARLKAALQSNIARRKARVHAARQPENPPHDADGAAGPGGDG